jgi:hypothetical protein
MGGPRRVPGFGEIELDLPDAESEPRPTSFGRLDLDIPELPGEDDVEPGQATDARRGHATDAPAPALPTLTARHSIPHVRKTAEEIAKLPLDHRAGFLLAHIDGMHTMEEILDICAMPPEEALMLIEQLKKLEVIEID